MADIVFMGTPAFAVPSLDALIAAGHRIKGVVTQPDRPVGRGQRIQPPPVKAFASERGIPILQPGRLRREPEAVGAIRDLAPDLVVVVAFGQILPQDVLDIPPRGCLNVHGSLLPAYRGAAPIQWALINGDQETGVTTMLMDAGMDTGPTFLDARIPVAAEDDAGMLGERMAIVGARLLVETVDRWLAGAIAPVAQPSEGVSLAPLLRKEHGQLDFSQPARLVHDRVRGVTPWPGAYTSLDGEPLKILRTAPLAAETAGGGEPGALLDITRDGWVVATGEGCLVIRTVQLPGKRTQDAADAARGLRTLKPGIRLGRQAASRKAD